MTSRVRFLPAALLAVFALAAAPADPLELGGTFLLENLRFDPDRPSSDLTFSGLDLYWGGSLYCLQPVTDNLSVEADLDRDTVLRHTGSVLLRFREGAVAVDVGPVFGLFSSPEAPLTAGVSTSAELTFPGVLRLRARADTPVPLAPDEPGSCTRERYEASLGFYIPNAILSFGVQQKKLTLQTGVGETTDGLTGFSLSTDIFQKNVPYRVNLAISFETLSREYDESGTVTGHTLSSILLDTRLDWTFREYLTILLDLRSSVYTFGRDDLLGISNPGPGGFLFRLYTGFALDLGRMPDRSGG